MMDKFRTSVAVQLSQSFWITLYLWTDTSVVEEHAASIFMVGIIGFRLGWKGCLKDGYLYIQEVERRL